MSNSQLEVKRLSNEVQLLRDELAIMKRKYEDIIYNLDTDNFSSRFVKEQGDMRTAIEITAEGIKTKVSKEDLNKSLSSYSTIEQTADKIKTAVESVNTSTDEKLKNYSTIEQTAQNITSTVSKEYVTNLIGDDYVTDDALNEYKATVTSTIDQKADGIYATVEANYESVNGELDSMWGSISSVSVEADNISTRVGKVENGKFGDYTLFTQSNNTFKFDGKYMLINSAIQIADDSGKHSFSIFHNEGNGASAGWRGTYMGAAGNNLTDPLFLGSSTQKVYLYDYGDDNLIATQGWVRANAGGGGGTATAVFG